jgi:hypothetical protein
LRYLSLNINFFLPSLHAFASLVGQSGVTTSAQPVDLQAERWLLLLFLLSLPLLNPWVRGDGVGYYAFARAPLIQHNLDFTSDYQHANESFRESRLDAYGQPRAEFRTVTGHLDNHFTVGPALLWSPFLLLADSAVLLARALGSSVAADGFSAPYRLAMAFATACYGFLALLLSFRIARQCVEARWAFLSALAIWWASSLPVYMYFNPSWSHAHSAFAVALFLWYWHKTRSLRSFPQWLLLGVLAGLMLNVYYANAMLLAVLVVEALPQYASAFRARAASDLGQLALRHLLFCLTVFVCLFPTFLTRYIIYGNPFASGYLPLRDWSWLSPNFFAVLFSSDHGLFSWTPILLLAVLGLFFFWRTQPRVALAFLAAALAFYLFITVYPDWNGISSFGSRFFVSLTPLFVLGLAVFLERTALLFRTRRAALFASSALLSCFILWNAGLMFQWGAHLIPARGPVSFRLVLRNQFSAAPRRLASDLHDYFFHRRDLMHRIEQRDLQQLKQNPPPR